MILESYICSADDCIVISISKNIYLYKGAMQYEHKTNRLDRQQTNINMAHIPKHMLP